MYKIHNTYPSTRSHSIICMVLYHTLVLYSIGEREKQERNNTRWPQVFTKLITKDEVALRCQSLSFRCCIHLLWCCLHNSTLCCWREISKDCWRISSSFKKGNDCNGRKGQRYVGATKDTLLLHPQPETWKA